MYVTLIFAFKSITIRGSCQVIMYLKIICDASPCFLLMQDLSKLAFWVHCIGLRKQPDNEGVKYLLKSLLRRAADGQEASQEQQNPLAMYLKRFVQILVFRAHFHVCSQKRN